MSYLEVDVPLLDVGCGSSRLIQSIAAGVGVDLDLRKVRYLRSRAPAVVAGNPERLPFRDESFPQVVCSNPLENGARFGELRRVLRPGGTLVVGTPPKGKALVAQLRGELEQNGFAIDTVKHVGRSEAIFRAVRR